MALSPGEMHARIIDNLMEKTGLDLSGWLERLQSGPETRKDRIAWLKQEHGLGHGIAGAIAREYEGDVPWSKGSDLEVELLENADDGVRSDYQRLKTALFGLDAKVEAVYCKTYTGFRVRTQFAILKPTKDGLAIGLALDPATSDDLIPSGSLGGSKRIASRIKPDLPQSTINRLLKTAYDQN
ncbi:MAG: DUF4287 domain-containing protein [Pseudomonadota bacterium]